MPNLPEKVQKFIHRKNLIPGGEKTRLLCAVSGGPDSVVMLHVLKTLGYDCAVAHVNYGLRPEAEEEADFVRSLANRWDFPVHIHQAASAMLPENRTASVQAEARRIRYDFFASCCLKFGYNHIVTAHHKEDQVETLLMNLLRGKSSRVMKGIPTSAGQRIRPLIEITKVEILGYAKEQNLTYYIDATNAQNKYLRNKVRNQLLPLLKEINPNVIDHLIDKWQLAEAYVQSFEQSYQEWKSLVERPAGKGEEQKILFNPEEMQRLMGKSGVELGIIRYLEEKGIPNKLIQEVLKIRDSESGKSVFFNPGLVQKDRGQLVFLPDKKSLQSDEGLEVHQEQCEGGAFQWKGYRITFSRLPVEQFPGSATYGAQFLDFHKVRFPIRLRRWQEGDRMQPLGMKGTKKLSDIFVDGKWPQYQKNTAVVVEDQEQIISLLFNRISEQVKVDSKTLEILKIEVAKL